MFSFNKRIRSVAEIHFAAHAGEIGSSGSKVTWRSDEDVVGSVVFKLPPGVEFARSKILLKGVVATHTEDSPRGCVPQRWRTEKIPFLAVCLESKAGSDFRSTNGIIKIPFRFNLDRCNRSGDAKELPPSVNSKEDAKWWTSLKHSEASSHYDISYSIAASCYSKRELLASIVHTLSVLPIAEAQPPSYASHFGNEAGEYFHAISPARQSKKQTSLNSPRYQVGAQEPKPLRLHMSGHAIQPSLTIPLVLKFLPSGSGMLDQEALPTQFQLKARLVTRTLITPNRMRPTSTMAEVMADADAHVKTTRSDEQDFTLSVPGWDSYGDSDEAFAITKLPFIFNIAADRVFTPTFFTPILSKRHSIELVLTFPNFQSSLELSLPLQAIHGADELDLGRQTKLDTPNSVHEIR